MHRLLFLKLDTQICGTISLQAISSNKLFMGLGGGEVPQWRWLDAVNMPCWMQNSSSTCVAVCLVLTIDVYERC